MNSLFQFTNPVLTKIDFSLNDGFDGSEIREVNIKTNFSVKVSREDNSNYAIVELLCEIGEINKDIPFHIVATEQADFKWPETLENEKVDSLLNQNAPALLLSYLRPIIAQITSVSPYGTYNIPFINFCKTK